MDQEKGQDYPVSDFLEIIGKQHSFLLPPQNASPLLLSRSTLLLSSIMASVVVDKGKSKTKTPIKKKMPSKDQDWTVIFSASSVGADFCPDCGSILPLPISANVSCGMCGYTVSSKGKITIESLSHPLF